jgi:EAL domain-containing protein (putative c-di-GMP-specific phosphodiesterase class I)
MVNLPRGREISGLHGVRSLFQGAILRLVRLYGLSVQGAILQVVRKALADSGIAPQQLELEITESLMLEDKDAHATVLHQLHSMGVRLALDDFGTGFSSLSYLKHMPFDVLKIDRSFVNDIGIDPADDAITVSIIGLARNLGMKSLAEGVETVQQREFLCHHGCNFEQGFLFSRPVPASDVVALLLD